MSALTLISHFKKSECTPLKLTLKKVSALNSFLNFHSFSAQLALIFPPHIYKKKINYDFAAHVTGKILVESYVVMVPDSYVEHF